MSHRDSPRNDSRNRSARLVVFFVLLAAVLFLTFLRSSTRPARPDAADSAAGPGVAAAVRRVIDGDSLQLRGGRQVRLLGIDTMDSHNEDRVSEQAWQLGMSPSVVRKWSERAERRTRALVQGRPVSLRYGPERTDDYDRLLAYVFVMRKAGKVHVNRLLIEEGLAVATRRFPHPHRKAFIALEDRARKKQRGLWRDATRVP
jgi:micrococcal nuclease